MVKVFPNKLLKQFTIKLNQTQSIVKLLSLTMQEQKTILKIKDKTNINPLGAWRMRYVIEISGKVLYYPEVNMVQNRLTNMVIIPLFKSKTDFDEDFY